MSQKVGFFYFYCNTMIYKIIQHAVVSSIKCPNTNPAIIVLFTHILRSPPPILPLCNGPKCYVFTQGKWVWSKGRCRKIQNKLRVTYIWLSSNILSSQAKRVSFLLDCSLYSVQRHPPPPGRKVRTEGLS